MEPQSRIVERRARLGQHARRGGFLLLAWTPVWIPLVFLTQLVVMGLGSARDEAARLDRAETELRARADALAAEEARLASEARMLADEVYRERVRRSLLDPDAEPLTLERARTRTP